MRASYPTEMAPAYLRMSRSHFFRRNFCNTEQNYMKRITRNERNRIHLVKDVEFVICPYCGKQMQFLHWQHLKTHNKTIKDVRREFPNIPTMTKKDIKKRSNRRVECEEQIINTCNNRYGGIGYSSDELKKKSYKTNKKKYGRSNIMKTEHGKNYFKGDLNPLRDPETAKKVSNTLTGQPSKLKGKTYEEILGEEKTLKRKKELKKSGAYGQSITPRISAPQLELFKLVKDKYPTAVLEYPVLDYCLDIAVPELKLCFEYDGSYWHDIEKDKIRDEVLSKFGWIVRRFIDELPVFI